jgi:cysteine-rich repeat protein
MPRPRLALALVLALACNGADDDDTSSPTLTMTPPGGDDTVTPTTGATGAASDATGAEAGDAVCGDGVVQSGEPCDDGNQVDFDACSNACVLPTCDDGQRNGSESDIDCGGTCPQCGDTGKCNQNSDCTSGLCDRTCVGLYPNCREMHSWHQSLPDGTYDIDPDGDGVPLSVHCDMLSGGWTEVGRDTFENVEGWSAGTTAACGTWSAAMLGGPGQFGAGATTEKTFTTLGVPHEKLRAVAEAIIVDNWENETLEVAIDGAVSASIVCNQGIPNSCAPREAQCGAPQYTEGKATLRGERPHTTDSALIRFSSSLDMDAGEESWALDSVSVAVF